MPVVFNVPLNNISHGFWQWGQDKFYHFFLRPPLIQSRVLVHGVPGVVLFPWRSACAVLSFIPTRGAGMISTVVPDIGNTAPAPTCVSCSFEQLKIDAVKGTQ